MFLAATTRPRQDKNFNGLIGIWRVAEKYTAKRNSAHHDVDDVYDKDCTMDAKFYRKMIIELVFPAIWYKMPWLAEEGYDYIHCQQDGALPHTGNDTEAELDDAGERLAEIFGDNGTLLPIRMLTQPAQSYDTNVNDLAFFSSHAARFNRLQKHHDFGNLDKLAETVEKTFYETDPATLEKCFQTKTRVLSSILSVDGGNKYPLPRSGR